MPLYGVRDVSDLLTGAPLMESLDAQPVELPRAEVLQVMFEIDDGAMLDLLPRALHPTIPPSVTFVFWRCPESPWGAFQMAQVRVGCRAGVRPRGFPVAVWCDSEAASAALRAGWGYDCRPGGVRLKRNYDRITGTVVVQDRTLLQVSLLDPQAISGGDVQYVANMNLANVRHGGEVRPRLVQVDPEFTFHRADRGRALVEHFEADAATAGITPVYAVSAHCAVCDITLPRLRYIVDPDRPAMVGTVTLTEGEPAANGGGGA
jgi:hypothetical protein